MKILLVVLGIISLVLSQSSTTSSCGTSTCYPANTVPPCDTGFYCDKSSSATIKPGCEYVCIRVGANATDHSIDSERCTVCTAKPSCATNQKCTYYPAPKNCYYCESVSTCSTAPCNLTCTEHGYATDTNNCPLCRCYECPQVLCSDNCANGYLTDNKNCKTCQCKPCPVVSCDNIRCDFGYKRDPTTGCQVSCECNPPPSPTCKNCTDPTTGAYPRCDFGYIVDTATNCKTCDCCKDPGTFCPAKCTNGYVVEKGCPTCTCINSTNTCQKYCASGYKQAADGTTLCECYCPPPNCLTTVNCANGRVRDAYGCETCECIPKYDTCTKPICNAYCQYGYKTDSAGCPECTCREKPVCSPIACAVACDYGFITEADGCPTCRCKPCPDVVCSRYCQYGWVKGISSGCPVCLCADKPDCPVAVTADTCGINCKYGYVNNSGCPSCFCSSYDRCSCPVRPTETITCSDRKTYDRYSSVCRQDGDKCYWVETKCPIALEIKFAAGSTLTTQEQVKIVLDLKNSFQLPDSDIKLEVTLNTDGSKSYKLYVSADAIPADKKPEDIRDTTTLYLKNGGKDATAFLISDTAPNPPGNYGSIVLVPVILGLLFILF